MSSQANLEFSRQPWSTYAVHLTTLSPPALLGDLLLIFLCHKATENLDGDVHYFAMRALGIWMFVSKFIKLMGHYRRYPADFLLLPVSILFGYFHGAIKIYAAVTLNVVSPYTSFIIINLVVLLHPLSSRHASLVCVASRARLREGQTARVALGLVCTALV